MFEGHFDTSHIMEVSMFTCRSFYFSFSCSCILVWILVFFKKSLQNWKVADIVYVQWSSKKKITTHVRLCYFQKCYHYTLVNQFWLLHVFLYWWNLQKWGENLWSSDPFILKKNGMQLKTLAVLWHITFVPSQEWSWILECGEEILHESIRP